MSESESRSGDSGSLQGERRVAQLEAEVASYQQLIHVYEESVREQSARIEAARELAEAATRVKAAFLATMSHEIRTPLNAVIGLTGLLLDTSLDEQQRDYTLTIRSSGDHLLTVINDILDFSKIEAGGLELEQHPFEIIQCVEESLDLIADKAGGKDIDLAYVVGNDVPHQIVGDAGRLRQVLVNLLGNAVKFTASGEVVLSLEARPLGADRVELRLAVRDTGVGIPPDRLDRLFKPFSQVDTSTSRTFGGTGLGLAISKNLVERMGGRIWVESQNGQGTTFTFTIAAAIAPGPDPVAPAVLTGLAGRRLLIVEDNATNRNILQRQAECWGAVSRATHSPQQALQWIRGGERFDLGILDHHMPEMDGPTLAREIRQINSAEMLPLVLLTSTGSGARDLTRAGGPFQALLTKPIHQSSLFDVIAAILGQRRQRREPTALNLDSQLATRHPLRILVAEDNMVNQKVILALLGKLGYRADMAANGCEVLAALDRQRYDVLLMDVHMPVMDGLEATRQICRLWPAGRRPRIVGMTAAAMVEDRRQGAEAGMDDYLIKPVAPSRLVSALRECQPMDVPAAEPPPPATAPPILEERVLSRLASEIGADEIPEIVAAFIADTPKQLADLQEAIAKNDSSALTRTAHTLRSTSSAIGASALATACFELECPRRTGTDFDPAAGLALAVERFHQTRQALEAAGFLNAGRSTPEQAQAAASELDPAALAKLRRLGKGGTLACEIIDLFLADTPPKLLEARAAIQRGDLAALRFAMHWLRSSARNVGARLVGELATRLEQLAVAPLPNGLPSLMDQLDAAFARAKTQLAARRDEH